MQRSRFRVFFDRLKKKFQISISNESTLETFFSLRVSRLDGIFLAASLFIVLFAVSFVLIAYTPLSGYLPERLDPGAKKQLIDEAYRVDSLTDVIYKQTRYISAVKGMIAGELPVDSFKTGREIPIDTFANHHLELMKATDEENKFRKDYEEKEKYNLSTLSPRENNSIVLFYPPVKGKRIYSYDPKLKRYGTDIEVNGRQAVLSVLDGTVIFAGYIPDYQYVIDVQHSNGYISVYKFNAELLKKQGDVVRAGEAIAIVDRVAPDRRQPHLFFELWQKGLAMNPEEYIVF